MIETAFNSDLIQISLKAAFQLRVFLMWTYTQGKVLILPHFTIIFARIYKTVTCDTICTADDHVKIACKGGVSKGENIYTKILRKYGLFMVFTYLMKVLVFICKL